MSLEEVFFGEGNRLRWSAIQAGGLSDDTRERLGPFLDDLGRGVDELILPRVADGIRVIWYVLCRSGRAKRMARDELRAMLGATYSDLDARPGELDASDPFDVRLTEAGAKYAFRLEPPADRLDVCRERLLLWRRLRDERPARSSRVARPTGRILRDFEFALQASDGDAALACISELKASGRLDAVNLLFLEVRRLGALRQWSAIISQPEFDAVVAMNRPRRVTEVLISALYEEHIVAYERVADASGALAEFRSKVFQPYGRLFASREGLRGFEVDASFLLSGAVADPPRVDVVERVLSEIGEARGRRAFLEAIALRVAQASRPAAADLLETARALFAREDADGAMQTAISAPPSLERSALLLRCARDMGSLGAAKAALESVAALDPDEQEMLKSRAVVRQAYDALAEMAVPTQKPERVPVAAEIPVPGSWQEWMQALLRDERWAGAVSVAERGAREWDTQKLFADSDATRLVATLLLEDRPLWAQEALRDSMPFVIEAMVSGEPDPRLRAVYESLHLVLAVDEQVSVPQAMALVKVAEARLQLGTDPGVYREVVETLSASIERIDSPALVAVALEAIDMLVRCPSSAPDLRQQFAAAIANQLSRWFRRVERHEWKAANQLFVELKLPEVQVPADTEGDEADAATGWDLLAGKFVALYSLTESVLRRVERILRELAPGIRVESFHEKYGGSPALKAASAKADLFVIATESAKHAATISIENQRPAGALTAYARGKGSASMLQAIKDSLAVLAREAA